MSALNEINVSVETPKGETWRETGSDSQRLNGESIASPKENFSSGSPLVSRHHQANLVSQVWFHIRKLVYTVNY